MTVPKPWDGEALCNSLRRSIEAAYSLKRKNKGKSIPYNGPELTSPRILASSSGVQESLTDDGTEWCGLQYHEDRGRDALDVILILAIQLGMEQGWRMLSEDFYMHNISLRSITDSVEDHVPEGHHREFALAAIEALQETLENPGRTKPD